MAEFDNMNYPLIFSTVGNGIWEMGQMGNGALEGFGALRALGYEMLGNEENLKETEAIRLTRCIDSCLY